MTRGNHGIVVYDILPNGCLNGVCADTLREAHNHVFNEILKKKRTSTDSGLNGDYICAYTGINDEILQCDVQIRNKDGKIQIQWLNKIDGRIEYEGTGWLTRENQLTVSYRYM